MKFEIHVLSARSKPLVIEVLGTGSQEDPIIIQNKDFPPGAAILKNELFIIMRNCQVNKNALIIIGSKNITIEYCQFERLLITNGTNIKLNNCQIKKRFGFEGCRESEMINCSMMKLNLFKSRNLIIDGCIISKKLSFIGKKNTFKNCVITSKIPNRAYKNNTFENISN